MCIEDTVPGIPSTNVSFRVDMDDITSPHMNAQSWYGITPPADANEMEDRLRGPDDTDWDPENANHNILITNNTNGEVQKTWEQTEAEILDKTVVYFGSYYREYPRIREGNKAFWENYDFAYAFLDNRAIDDDGFIFIGRGEEDPLDNNTDILLEWYVEYIDGTSHLNIKDDLFDLLGITDPSQLLDMGMI